MQSEEIFQTISEWAQFSHRTPEKKATNHVKLTWKFPWKSCSTCHLPFLSSNPKILKAFLKIFPTNMNPTKCQAREKKMRQENGKKRGGGKTKSKVKTAVSPLLLLCRHCYCCAVHDWTAQADTLHLGQKATKCTTCKRLCGSFSSSGFKVHFSAKSPGVNGMG